ncbi:hypothetical protein NPIL_508591 [Nephila pilipes]|uniref:Uncharacterized protein n=1 Tax=Nephila pilipes TaxID=299642 RepID=A0A8X6ISH3_NEPPI|nr:hypothetical protein NPIL_508591 [Nephila pilipes]
MFLDEEPNQISRSKVAGCRTSLPNHSPSDTFNGRRIAASQVPDFGIIKPYIRSSFAATQRLLRMVRLLHSHTSAPLVPFLVARPGIVRYSELSGLPSVCFPLPLDASFHWSTKTFCPWFPQGFTDLQEGDPRQTPLFSILNCPLFLFPIASSSAVSVQVGSNPVLFLLLGVHVLLRGT